MIGDIIYKSVNRENRLICDGRYVATADYPELSAIIGETELSSGTFDELVADLPFSNAVYDGSSTKAVMWRIHNDIQYIYVAFSGKVNNSYVNIINKSDMSTFSLSTYYNFNARPNAIASDANYIYLGSSTSNFFFKVIDKQTFLEVSVPFSVTSACNNIKVDDEYIYLMTGATGYQVYRKSDWSRITMPSYAGNDYIQSLFVDDRYFYLMKTISPRLVIFDKSNNLSLLSTIDNPNAASSISSNTKYIFCGGFSSPVNPNVYVYDKNNLGSVITLTPESSYRINYVECDDSFLYVAYMRTSDTGGTADGLEIYDLSDFSVVTEAINTLRQPGFISSDNKNIYLTFSYVNDYTWVAIKKTLDVVSGIFFLPNIQPTLTRTSLKIPVTIQALED